MNFFQTQFIKHLLQVVTIIVTISYPLGIYFGLLYFDPRTLVLVVVAIMGIRVCTVANSPLNHWLWLPLLGLLGIWIWLSNNDIGLKLYPVLVNLSLFFLFTLSLVHPPTLIEKFARMRRPNLPQAIVTYTRYVTIIWSGFFLLNASIALATTLWASTKVWAIYNGLISYCLIALLFSVEYIVRIRVRKKYGN